MDFLRSRGRFLIHDEDRAAAFKTVGRPPATVVSLRFENTDRRQHPTVKTV